MVLGMCKCGKYEEIGTMIPKVCQFAVEKGIQIQGPPIFVCHEGRAEEAHKANEEGNADINEIICGKRMMIEMHMEPLDLCPLC